MRVVKVSAKKGNHFFEWMGMGLRSPLLTHFLKLLRSGLSSGKEPDTFGIEGTRNNLTIHPYDMVHHAFLTRLGFFKDFPWSEGRHLYIFFQLRDYIFSMFRFSHFQRSPFLCSCVRQKELCIDLNALFFRPADTAVRPTFHRSTRTKHNGHFDMRLADFLPG